VAVDSSAGVDQIITTNRLSVWVGEKGEGIAGLAQHLSVDFRIIDTDGDWTNARLIKLLQILLNAPQLGVA
jgi:hypothetical protein